MADLTLRKLRWIKQINFLLHFVFENLRLAFLSFRFETNVIHFLFKRFYFIIKDNFLSLVIEVFIDLFDVDFNSLACSFLHDLEIILICQGNLIIILINIVKLIFGWKLFKNILDVDYKSSKGCLIFWVEDMDLFVVYDFEKH